MEDSADHTSPNQTVQSPSLALLERLQQLRKWQEEQREALLQTHSSSSFDVSADSFNHSRLTGNQSFGSGSLKDTPDSQFSKSSGSRFSHQHESYQKVDQNTPTQRINSFREQVHGNQATWSAAQRHDESVSDLHQKSSFRDHDPKNITDFGNTDYLGDRFKYGKEKTYEVQSKAPLVRPVLHTARSVESQPVNSRGKTFEDILEENMAREGFQGNSECKIKPKKPFLKKRSGLSHYEGKGNCDTKTADPPASVLRYEIEELPVDPVQGRPKQRYLRKGEGTARFRMAPLRLKKQKVIQVPGDSGTKKTIPTKPQEDALTNPRPSANVRVGNKGPVSHNKLSRTYPSKISNMPISRLQLKDIPKTAGMTEVPVGDWSPGLEEGKNESQMAASKSHEPDKIKGCKNTFVPSVLKQLEDDKQRRKEQEELSAFEKLEELAADSSFSSNSSTVWQLLQRGQRSASSTPLRSPPPFTPQETPITKVSNQQQGSSVASNLLQRLFQAGVIAEENQSRNQQNTAHDQLKPVLRVKHQQEHTHNQLPQQLLSVSTVLEQLRAIVRLEETANLSVSQDDVQTLIESFIKPNNASPLDPVTSFLYGVQQPINNRTSTPAQQAGVIPSSGPRVHFRSEGVEVLEYEPTDTEAEDSLIDAPSIAEDDTDLVTTSDLEALALLTHKSNQNKSPSDAKERHSADEDDSSTSTLIDERSATVSTPQNKVQPLMLQFSPPPQRPHHSASNYIWSIFGRDRDAGKDVNKDKIPCQSRIDRELPHSKHKNQQNVQSTQNKDHPAQQVESQQGQSVKKDEKGLNDEIESHKALLLAKICELEKETEAFKKETLKLKNVQQSLQNEKRLLGEEKEKLVTNLEKEKINFQKYVDRERNSLWKEKQELQRAAPSISMVQEKSLEIVYLKEKVHDLEEELQKKDSLHQFAIKKFNDRIKALEQENKQLREKNSLLQMLEKENLDLKHRLDRTKLSKKPALRDVQNKNQTKTSKMKKKTVTIDSINRSLSKNLSEAPLKSVTCHIEPTTRDEEIQYNPPSESDENQDLVKNNVRYQAQISDKIMRDGTAQHPQETDLIKESIALKEDLSVLNVPKETKLPPVSGNLFSADDKISEYTEVHRSDGITEVTYANGNKKFIYPNGSIVVSYYNGDKKEVHNDRTTYIYGTDHTSHTTYNDGKEILEFPSGQKETRFPDGSSEIVFADNSRKTISKDGTETCTMKDGTVVRTSPDGTKVFDFANGQREIHTNKEKRREYPDGTVKILHPDGRTETRYKTGRVRIKDSRGNIISDTHQGVP